MNGRVFGGQVRYSVKIMANQVLYITGSLPSRRAGIADHSGTYLRILKALMQRISGLTCEAAVDLQDLKIFGHLGGVNERYRAWDSRDQLGCHFI